VADYLYGVTVEYIVNGGDRTAFFVVYADSEAQATAYATTSLRCNDAEIEQVGDNPTDDDFESVNVVKVGDAGFYACWDGGVYHVPGATYIARSGH
tara:strand:+ start:200 stop:487 length:288 start_codon:yes stop_codon:yes gene_type:complete